jgi:hypothetical protein
MAPRQRPAIGRGAPIAGGKAIGTQRQLGGGGGSGGGPRAGGGDAHSPSRAP